MSEQYSGWRVFFDDHWIASRSGVARTSYQAAKHPNNPLLSGISSPDRRYQWADKPDWGYGSVVRDPGTGKFRAYCRWLGSKELTNRSEGMRGAVVLAESDDGIAWEFADLGYRTRMTDTMAGLAPIVVRGFSAGGGSGGDFYVNYDPDDPDPNKRWKGMLFCIYLNQYGYSKFGGVMMQYISADGREWRCMNRKDVNMNNVEAASSDVNRYFYDSRTKKHLLFSKGWNDWPPYHTEPNNPDFRNIVRQESDDFFTWSDAVPVLSHALTPADPQSYGMSVGRCGDVLVGLVAIYDKQVADGVEPTIGTETIAPKLVFSRDLGMSWSYLNQPEFFLPLGSSGTWDDGMIFTANHFSDAALTYFYYAGWDGPHNTAERTVKSGLATIKKHRYVSLSGTGDLSTKPIMGAQGPLRINGKCSPGGSISAELRSSAGMPIAGFTFADCTPFTGDSVDHAMAWVGQTAPNQSDVVVAFNLVDAELTGFNYGEDTSL